MSHRPLTNTSSLKITAAYCTYTYTTLGEGQGKEQMYVGKRKKEKGYKERKGNKENGKLKCAVKKYDDKACRRKGNIEVKNKYEWGGGEGKGTPGGKTYI
jgi:hypothetical protein